MEKIYLYLPFLPTRNKIIIEDIVNCKLNEILQCNVAAKINLTFGFVHRSTAYIILFWNITLMLKVCLILGVMFSKEVGPSWVIRE